MRTILLPAAFLLLAPLALGCGADEAPATNPDPDTTAPMQFRQDGELDVVREGQPLMTLGIEIAETDSARARGMMGRTAFPERSGMLFIFDVEQIQNFWMANTPMSLDLLFISADSEIVDIHTYARPFSDAPITSREPARYVLEVPAGFVDTHGLIETDRVRWRRTDGAAPDTSAAAP